MRARTAVGVGAVGGEDREGPVEGALVETCGCQSRAVVSSVSVLLLARVEEISTENSARDSALMSESELVDEESLDRISEADDTDRSYM